jgi:hypothetical protein
MDTTKRRAGRPKSEPRSGPLVLGDDRSREKIEVALSSAIAGELVEYAGWVELSSSLTTADATSTTIEYALREVFRRDRVWQERQRSGTRPRSPATASSPAVASPTSPALPAAAAPPATAPTTATARTHAPSPSLPPPAPTSTPRDPRPTS